MRNLLRRFKRWWIAILAVLLIIVVALVVFGLLGGSVRVAEENQRIATVRMGTLTKQVTIDGSIAFPGKQNLTFASQGFVAEILVGEGEEVKAGQPLARLDPESVARLQQAVAQARLDLLDAQDAVANALNPTLALAQAEKSVSDAKLALRAAERELDVLLEPDAHEVARAAKSVFDAELALRAAERELDGLLEPDAHEVTRAEKSVFDAELALRAAERELNALLNPAAHDVAVADKSVSDAKSALRAAERELDALLNPDAHQVAEAEKGVADARVAVQSAQDALDDGLADAQADVDAAMRDLDAARHNLLNAQNTDGLAQQIKAVDEKTRAYAAAVAKWTGADLPQEELTLAPDALFTEWGFDPNVVFGEGYELFPDGRLRDNPATRWNELTVYAWTSLHPASGNIRVTCEESDGQQMDVSRYGYGGLCIRGDIDKAWEALDDVRRRLSGLRAQHESAVAQADAGVIRAEKALAEAQKGLAGLRDGPRSELPQKRLALARANLEKATEYLAKLVSPDAASMEDKRGQVVFARSVVERAEAELAKLLSPDAAAVEDKRGQVVFARSVVERAEAELAKLLSPDTADVEDKRGQIDFARSGVERAEADLEKLTSPDAAAVGNARAGITLAKANLAASEKALADLDARRDLEVTLKRAEVVSAQAKVDGAVSRLDDSTLEAPSDGYVSRILVKEREEVDAAKTVMEVIDFAVVEVKGRVDEIDVLSLERGMTTTIKLDSLPDQRLQGVVANISSEAANQQGIVTFAVDVKVTVPDGLKLQEGLSASAKAALGEERGLLVPNQAIRGDYDNPTVFVVVGDGTEERAVTLGSSDRYQTVVLQGLSEGEQVVYEVEELPSAFQTSVGIGEPPPEEFDEDP